LVRDQDLTSGLYYVKARKEFATANKLLQEGLKDPEELAYYTSRKWNGRNFPCPGTELSSARAT
jgi:hypothetical protein